MSYNLNKIIDGQLFDGMDSFDKDHLKALLSRISQGYFNKNDCIQFVSLWACNNAWANEEPHGYRFNHLMNCDKLNTIIIGGKNFEYILFHDLFKYIDSSMLPEDFVKGAVTMYGRENHCTFSAYFIYNMLADNMAMSAIETIQNCSLVAVHDEPIGGMYHIIDNLEKLYYNTVRSRDGISSDERKLKIREHMFDIIGAGTSTWLLQYFNENRCHVDKELPPGYGGDYGIVNKYDICAIYPIKNGYICGKMIGAIDLTSRLNSDLDDVIKSIMIDDENAKSLKEHKVLVDLSKPFDYRNDVCKNIIRFSELILTRY